MKCVKRNKYREITLSITNSDPLDLNLLITTTAEKIEA